MTIRNTEFQKWQILKIFGPHPWLRDVAEAQRREPDAHGGMERAHTNLRVKRPRPHSTPAMLSSNVRW